MRTIVFILSLFLLVGCSKRGSSPLNNWMANNEKPKVLSTTAMIDDLVGQIGQDRVDHIALIVGEIDPHSYQLVKGDDEKLSFATIVFCNGLGLEHGASLRYHLEHHPTAVAIGDEIQKKHPEMILIRDNQTDPHIWMDISLWLEGIDPIVKALSKADPANAPFYEKNAEALRQKMKEAHRSIVERMKAIPEEKRFLVTSHDAFDYFTRAYLAEKGEEWQKRFEAPEGLAPEGQLSASDIQNVIRHLCFYRIGVVFPESNVSRDSLKKIVQACLEKGLNVRISSEVLYGDAMGPPGSDYLQMIEHNAKVLEKEWRE